VLTFGTPNSETGDVGNMRGEQSSHSVINININVRTGGQEPREEQLLTFNPQRTDGSNGAHSSMIG